MATFKGNKASLPSKPCQCCGREMTWRKSWAKNWADVKYCSTACRLQKGKTAVAPALLQPPRKPKTPA